MQKDDEQELAVTVRIKRNSIRSEGMGIQQL